MDEKTGRVIYSSIYSVFAGAKGGDRIQVYDAYGLKRICDVRVSEADSRAVWKHKMKRHLTSIAAFLRGTSSVAGQDGQIRMPQFLMTVGANLRENASNTRVLIFGKPGYRDDRDPAFTFGGDGSYPSDKHLRVYPKDSVFGTRGRENVLAGVAVDFCYLSEENFHSEREKTYIVRFFTLYISSLGGCLTTCLPVPQMVVERALSGVTNASVPRAEIDLSDTKLEIHKVGARRAESGPSAVPPAPTLPELEEEQKPAEPVTVERERVELAKAVAAIPKPKAGFLSIAAVWVSEDSQADIDIWVRPHPKAQEICFSRKETPEGRLLRDVITPGDGLSDGNWRALWEVIEVKKTALDETSCWINHYAGSGARIEGVVRLLFDGRAVDVPFSFEGNGDGCRGRVNREESDCWLAIDVAELWSKARPVAVLAAESR